MTSLTYRLKAIDDPKIRLNETFEPVALESSNFVPQKFLINKKKYSIVKPTQLTQSTRILKCLICSSLLRRTLHQQLN